MEIVDAVLLGVRHLVDVGLSVVQTQYIGLDHVISRINGVNECTQIQPTSKVTAPRMAIQYSK